jgi:ABC-type Fe3+/spermidine/putrescine transport system ATPase subunit
MSLTLNDLSVKYGAVRALDGVSLELKPGEMFFLLGPSGCGKSTLLRTVAGFIEEFDGSLAFAGAPLKGLPPHKRDFGMVFQNYALFPHMTVAGNVAFGLEARNVPKAERETRVAEALKMVGLAGYESRRPGELSGGQQQRVALARALVIRPRMLLLDEPLSNLDAKLRWEMREEIRNIHRKTKITTLYVTHDQKEALSLADRMAILRAGKLEALGSPRELYVRPPNRFTAEFLGDVNILEGTATSDGRAAETLAGTVPLSLEKALSPGAKVTLVSRPENARLLNAGETAPAAHAVAAGRVVSSAFLGENTLYEVELPGGQHWRVMRSDAEGGLADAENVSLAVPHRNWVAV